MTFLKKETRADCTTSGRLALALLSERLPVHFFRSFVLELANFSKQTSCLIPASVFEVVFTYEPFRKVQKASPRGS